jgi:hypothetical protein
MAIFSLLIAASQQVPIIITGWDMPYPAEFRAHYKKFDSLPFDGTGIQVANFSRTFQNEKWNLSDYATDISDLNAVAADAARKLKLNFAIVNSNPGSVDWFDDAAWKEMVNHFRVIGRVAKQGGLAGIVFDPEPYVKPLIQFQFGSNGVKNGRTYDETQLKVKQRGEEAMTAFAAEFPEAQILMYHGWNAVDRAVDSDGNLSVVSGQWYDLFPAFLNGWMKIAPATMTFIDGNEQAYTYNDRTAYLASASRMRKQNHLLLAPEMREKVRRQWRVGQAFYLDAYLNGNDTEWFVDRKGKPTAEALRKNLEHAKESADGIIWIYGESNRWWPGGEKNKTWQNAIPGIVEAFRAVQGDILPVQGNNLVTNGDVIQKEGWGNWQAEGSKGTFAVDTIIGRSKAGSLKITGTRGGSWYSAVSVIPGKGYQVECWTTGTPGSRGYLMVRWKTKDEKWISTSNDQTWKPKVADGVKEWSQIRGSVIVPDDAEQMILIAVSDGSNDEKQIRWFDDFRVTASE